MWSIKKITDETICKELETYLIIHVCDSNVLLPFHVLCGNMCMVNTLIVSNYIYSNSIINISVIINSISVIGTCCWALILLEERYNLLVLEQHGVLLLGVISQCNISMLMLNNDSFLSLRRSTYLL